MVRPPYHSFSVEANTATRLQRPPPGGWRNLQGVPPYELARISCQYR